MEKNIRVALGDGNGCFSNVSFWKDFFEKIDCEFVDFVDDLNALNDIDPMFPSIVCLNTKQRLSRATKLAKCNLTHIIYFLRDDKKVHNCPSSIYRVQWLKEYWKRYNVQVIVWKEDLAPKETDFKNLELLAAFMHREKEFRELDPSCLGMNGSSLPKRKMAYDFSRVEGKKTYMVIGIAPHIVDPYRKSLLMDSVLEKYNIVFPHLVTGNFQLPDRPECGLKLYKTEGILEAIRMVFANELCVDGFIFVSDAFDIPGRFSFPMIKAHLKEQGVYEFDINNPQKGDSLQFLSLITSFANQVECIKKIEEFANET